MGRKGGAQETKAGVNTEKQSTRMSTATGETILKREAPHESFWGNEARRDRVLGNLKRRKEHRRGAEKTKMGAKKGRNAMEIPGSVGGG